MEYVMDAHRSLRFPAIRGSWQAIGLVAVLACLPVSAWAQSSPCDLNGDSKVDKADYDLAVSMSVGSTPCTANVVGPGVCNAILVQRIANATLPGGSCVTGTGHSSSLSWAASTSTGVVGYNIYRGTASGGPYTQLNTAVVTTTSYEDTSALAGQTYYYVVKAVGSSGSLSIASNEAKSVVPTP